MTALPRQLSRVGKRGARWQDWQKRQRALVMQRCRGCCEVSGCWNRATDWHHTINRRLLSEPLVSHHTLGAGVCRPHHRGITDAVTPDDVLDGDDLAHDAVERACHYFRHPELFVQPLCSTLDVARELERILKADTEAWQALLEEAGVA